MPANHSCRRCPLHETTSNVCIWGEGPKHCDIMLIGEAPGATEEQLGRPFVGASGKAIDHCLLRAGTKRSKVYIANALKCRPPGNRDPSKEELGACWPYLAEEIAAIKPKVIVCVGLQALKVLTSETTLSRSRGKLLTPIKQVRVGDAKIIATYHPAASMYNGAQRQHILDSIVEDLKYAQNLASPSKITGARILLHEGYTSDRLIEALHSIQGARELACDLEWLSVPGKKVAWPWTPNISLLSMSLTGKFGDAYGTVAFAWPPKAKGLAALKSFLTTRQLIFHNAMADVIWLLSAGFEPIVGDDSMLLAYLLDEHRRAGLKGLAPLVAGVEAGWEQKPWHRRPRTREGWLELLGYNADDTENTYKLRDALVAQLVKLPKERAGNIARVYKRLLLPAVKPFARMALAGTPINREKLAKQLSRQDRLMRQNIARLAKSTGLREDVAERLANSPAQVTRYAREAYGLEVETSRADDLDTYAEQYTNLKRIKNIKHHRKFKSTYLEPWGRLLDHQGDGRLHSIYLLGATRTGRLSAELEEGGSLLLVPREEVMRDLIDVEAEDSEFEILSADYSQIELRIIAWLAPERNMRRLFNEGADLHVATAAYLLSKMSVKLTVKQFWKQRTDWEKEVDKESRQKAKGVNFGLDFGLQEEHLASYVRNHYGVNMSPEEAHEAHTGYFELYNDLAPWHNRAVSDYNQGLPTITPFGRYRLEFTSPTEQINTPIQSTASDLTMLALTTIDERLSEYRDDAQLIGFIHDCVLVRCRKTRRELVTQIISDAMEHPLLDRVGIEEIPVPLVAEVKHGATWSSAS